MMTDSQIPFRYTLLSATTVCSAFWSYALHDVLYVGALAFMLFQVCLACWAVIGLRKLVIRIRQAFTYAPSDLADFVAGKQDKPLTIDPEYAALQREIDKARAKHLPVKHLLVKQSARVHEMLGAGQ